MVMQLLCQLTSFQHISLAPLTSTILTSFWEEDTKVASSSCPPWKWFCHGKVKEGVASCTASIFVFFFFFFPSTAESSPIHVWVSTERPGRHMLSWIWSQLVGLLFSQVIMQRMVCETLPKRCSVWAAVSVMVRLDCSRGMEGLRCTTLMCPGL